MSEGGNRTEGAVSSSVGRASEATSTGVPVPPSHPSVPSNEHSSTGPLFSRLQTLLHPHASHSQQHVAPGPAHSNHKPFTLGPAEPVPSSSSSAKAALQNALPILKDKEVPPAPRALTAEELAAEQHRMTGGGHPFLKIRFLTWNMHDSIPKGDLTPLLGRVAPYSHPTAEELASQTVPPLPLNDQHPYHLIVIAGQECPTPSGIPMGLGAGVKFGFANSANSAGASLPTTPFRAPPNSPFGPPTSDKGSQSSQTSLSMAPSSSTAQSAPLTPATLDLPSIASVVEPSPPPSSATPSPPQPTAPSSVTSLLTATKDIPLNLSIQVSNLTSSPTTMAATSFPPPPNLNLLSPSVPSSPSTTPSTWLGVPTMKISPGTPPLATSPAAPTSDKAPQQTGSHLGDKEKEKEKERERHHFHHRNAPKEPTGWTDVLTDWFSNRVGEGPTPAGGPASSSVQASASEGSEESGRHLKETIIEDEGAGSKEGSSSRYRIVQEGRGTYELLAKERLLGIYLCVYVWKGCRHLVKNTSTSYVTTGLIGGRFGNKGGVACAVHLGSSRLLFVNSHLAAHASRSDVRLLNVAKIKAELDVDAFLSLGDERLLSEDPTDRYDATFWMGDLNFRLDVSRIHADWLVSRKEYAQALRFDQLKKIMEEGTGFVGFKEAEIDFAPTYKYDVAKPVKRSSTRSSRRKMRDPSLSGVVEASEHGAIEEADDDDGEEGEDVERSSILSSGWTSLNGAPSTFTSDEEDEPQPPPSSFPQQSQQLAEKLVHDAQKIFLPSTAIKAKKKLLGLIKMPASPSSSSAPSRQASVKRRPSNAISETSRSVSGASGSLDLDRTAIDLSTTPPLSNAPFAPSASPSRASIDGGSPPRPPLGRKLSARLRRSFSGRDGPSHRAPPGSDDDSEDSDGTGEGVYDTSSKKRVPSWCDRVLWKSFEEDYPEPVPLPPPADESPIDDNHPFARLNRIASALHIRRRNSREVKRSISITSQMSGTGPSPRTSLVTSTSFTETSPSISTSNASSSTQHVHWGTGSSQRNSLAESSSTQSNVSRSINGRRRSNSALATSASTTLTPPSSTTTSPARPIPTTRNSNPAPRHLSLLIDDDIVGSPPSPTRTVTSPPSSHPASPVVVHDRPGPQRFTSEPYEHKPFQPQTTPSTVAERPSWFSRLLQIHPSSTAGESEKKDDLPTTVQPEVVKRRKGEVLPLLYGTLDDAEMRTIQGFSDHRPVNAVMALFI